MEEMPVGIMTWVLSDPYKAVELARAVGVKTMQLGCPTDEYYSEQKKKEFKEFLQKSEIKVTTVFFGFVEEDYSSLGSGRLDSVIETVGFRNPKFRKDRIKKTMQISDFAKYLGVSVIAGHIGVVPEDQNDPIYEGMVEAVREVADYCKKNNQYLALETGLETSSTLLRFIKDVGRDNVRVNFDPANILYYGFEDPMESLEKLKDYVISVHCKDFKMPTKKGDRPIEVTFGEGDVGAERFIRKLKEIGYKGALNIEREIHDLEEQKKDMIKTKRTIEKIKAKILSEG
ncbi:MAG: sugar phosphate isomerase/epimerase family protein [Candidatus Bathyarchaeia archaeon]